MNLHSRQGAHTVARGPFSEPIQIRTLETCKNFSIGPHIGLNHCTSSQITFAQRTCFILRTLVLFPFCHYCRSIHSTDIFSYSSHCSTWQLLRHFHQLNNHYTLMESTTFWPDQWVSPALCHRLHWAWNCIRISSTVQWHSSDLAIPTSLLHLHMPHGCCHNRNWSIYRKPHCQAARRWWA